MSTRSNSSHQSVWTPGAGITRHADSPIPPKMEFFTTPPLEIGQVTSAESTLKTSTQAVPTPLRIIICLLAGLLGTGIGWLITSSASRTVIFGILAVLVAFWATRFSHRCSYVGENGIAIYTLKGDRHASVKAEILRFQDTTNLYTSQTRNYTNLIYRGTYYSYLFGQKSGKPFYVIYSFLS